MKGLIVYQGKYGATQQYATWTAEALQLPLFTPENIGQEEPGGCDFIVMGSAVYMGKLLMRNWIKNNSDWLQNKKLFLFIVCATPASEKNKCRQIISNNIPLPLLKCVDICFLPGRLTVDKLSRTHRLILKLGAWLEKDPAKKKAMLQDMDGVKKEHLQELIRKVEIFRNGQYIAPNKEYPVNMI